MAIMQPSVDFSVLLANLSSDQLPSYLHKSTPTPQMRSANAHNSGLLHLPQELRDHIMRMTIGDRVNVDPWDVSPDDPPPTWMQVCSQLRLDAAQVYFRTPIYLPYVKDEVYKKWVDALDVHYRPFVRAVHIDRYFPDHQLAIEYAAKKDEISAFRAGTVWVASSVIDAQTSTSIWLNSLGQTKFYADMVLPQPSADTVTCDKYDFISWD